VRDPDLAADVVQDALAKALARGEQLRDDEKLLPWFYRVLRNTIADVERRRVRDERHLAHAVSADQAEIPEPEHAELCACLGKLVDALPPEQKDLLQAIDLGNESTELAAQRLGITRNNLNVRRHRARKALEQQLHATCRLCAEHGCIDCDCSAP
jgi:RNA polymerase sigma-70 factor (ECF subfamily)